MNNHRLLQAKDITMIVGMCAIGVYLYIISNHVTHWDDTVSKEAVLEATVSAHTTTLAVITSQLADIRKDLSEIKDNTKH